MTVSIIELPIQIEEKIDDDNYVFMMNDRLFHITQYGGSWQVYENNMIFLRIKFESYPQAKRGTITAIRL